MCLDQDENRTLILYQAVALHQFRTRWICALCFEPSRECSIGGPGASCVLGEAGEFPSVLVRRHSFLFLLWFYKVEVLHLSSPFGKHRNLTPACEFFSCPFFIFGKYEPVDINKIWQYRIVQNIVFSFLQSHSREVARVHGVGVSSQASLCTAVGKHMYAHMSTHTHVEYF